MNKRTIAAGLAGSVAAAVLAASPTAHAAAPGARAACAAGSTSIAWKNVTEPYVITHVKRVKHLGGTRTAVSVTLPRIAVVRASVTGGTAPATVIRSLAHRTGLVLAASGKQTPAKAVDDATLSKAGAYVFYAGTRKVHGNFVARICNARGTGFSTRIGTATSWTTPPGKGVVLCGAVSVPLSGLAAKARSSYC